MIAPRYRRLAGLSALLLAAWIAMYGKLWSFEQYDEHRFTAKAILTGTLRLRGALSHLAHDEQVYNGAGYTNWGFGVPLLQVPFHALATALGLFHGFFPDRAIYFVYLAGMLPILWSALDALVARRASPRVSSDARIVLSWAAAWLVVTRVLFPLMSTRFVVYEDTIAYFDIFEILAASAYVFALRGSWSGASVCGLGLASGTALLIRPTGALYLAMWGALVLLERRAKALVVFAGSVFPFVVTWLYTNWVRTGSAIGLGYVNTNPAWIYHTPIERFGSQCIDSPGHALAATARLFAGFFFFASRTPASQWLKDCHFDFEERDGVLPFLGPPALALLVWTLGRYVARRERRIGLYLPYALMAVLFAGFVRRGQGFAWRYAGDFWPAMLVLAIQYFWTLPTPPSDTLDPRVARGMFAYGLFVFLWFLVPWAWATRPDLLQPVDVAAMGDDFEASRYGVNGPIPSKLTCAEHVEAPLVGGVVWETLPNAGPARAESLFHNGLGWRREGCAVDTFTNVYLGVPERPDGRATGERHVRIETSEMGMASVLLYVNGTTYTAGKSGDTYEADVTVPPEPTGSRVVMATILWTRGAMAPGGKLRAIELQ